ncbi:MAG: hypothetical protein KF730_06060 [Sphingomonas sp.]|uniref:hypothetical protein n=1 Tax=Sphingomonas sp. TaxID=28214 RepID=UPI0025DF41DB|nr:hypothetical protein [Sphingomonas sp.]MBX3564127.1 hypothetical protein [Sphingomonas sp.]
MTKKLTIRPRAALFIGAAFLATPAFAQDAPAAQTVTPPPIMVTPAPAPQAPAQRVIVIQPASPVVQAVPETPATAPAAAPARTTTTATTTHTTRAAATQTRAPAAAAQAPAAAPATAPASETPAAPVAAAPEATTPPPLIETQPEAATAPEVVTTTETSRSGVAWPWLLGGIALVIAGIAAALLMRRRDPEYVEQVHSEPAVVPVAAPAEHYAAPAPEARIAEPEPAFAGLPPAIPLAEPEVREAQAAAVATAEDVSVSEPARDDLAGVIDGAAPVSRRPWIELGMRPVRAGTNQEDAVVDFELTVGNSGDTAAKDVRISTFMLADAGSESEMEALLTGHRDDSAVPPVTIEPGEGTRIDAHLAASKEELGRTFNPVIVAEARYTLPDGSQGRTSAAFKVGAASETGVRPLSASRPFVTETVEAELFGVPEHA